MVILGINAYHGDVSAALVVDGRLVAAAEEERFRRVKHWAGFPAESVRACLAIGGVAPAEVDAFAVSRNPRAHLLRKALFTLRYWPDRVLVRNRMENVRRVLALPERLAEALGLDAARVRRRLHWVEHHPAHLASAFFVSPFEEAAVCAIDGFGDFVSTSWAVGRGSLLRVIRRTWFPHSLGLLYVALTQFLGFRSYGDEYKVMGLAAYGRPDFAGEVRRLVRLLPDGDFELDLSYFRHWSEGDLMTWDDGAPVLGPVYTEKLERLLGPARRPEEQLDARHEAIAASLQAVFEECVFHVLNALYRETRLPRLALAGGCAMNSLANGKIIAATPFREVFIQPAAADNGTSLGAAYWVWNQERRGVRGFVMEHAFWGPEASEAEVCAALDAAAPELERQGGRIRRVDDSLALCRETAAQLAAGKIVGWYQGRMEWGARALGHRSILADPRRAEMRELLNTKIKLREKFRPYAPAVCEESLHEYFADAAPDPFMTRVFPVRPEKRAVIPAVTHADGTARVQTVSRRANPQVWELLRAFEALTGVPVLLNTSFNENEPIVLRPAEALDCFLRTQMDTLALGPYVLEKPAASDVRESLAAAAPARRAES